MPLHLLGKKSWNVYNAENINRVQRDEAAAAAAEEAAEQRMQEVDAARRLAILRGETPPPLPEAEPEIDPSDKKFTRRDRDSSGFKSKKRKRAGEDDTDFEMRLARERAEMGGKVTAEIVQAKGDVDIVDKAGHIDLVGAPPTPAPAAEKNPEYEREAAKKKREMEDQYQMRFSNAAGRDGFSAGAPWYAKADSRRVALPADAAAAITTKDDVIAEIGIEAPTKDVWGNDDPRRKVRAVQRINTDDPLAMMKTGARRVREVEKERRREAEEREQELKELRREERRREKRRREERRHRDKDEDDSAGMRVVGETMIDTAIGTTNLKGVETETETGTETESGIETGAGQRTGIVNGRSHGIHTVITRIDVENVESTTEMSHAPVAPDSEAVVSTPSTVLTPPLPLDFSYSTRSNTRGRGSAGGSGGRGE
ncbi:hypothetical protein VPNG_05071 [Cytospora leucostoma]|uniref:CBF1-interacting co-repressor CIR N-terminal domain-containing protein n=1 Tax=Cytospora leucostoma TaxID=1230097 RepID=A0A423X477_9PEZI|nr:hypothetical protein VPNG_05071 [Cytospora leucostoma]